MALRIETFDNVRGGNTLYKALTHPRATAPGRALLSDLMCKQPIAIYDPNVATDADQGRNFLKHIAPLLRDSIKDVIAASEVVVVGNKYPGLKDAIESTGKPVIVIDLARIEKPENRNVIYHGLCW